MVHRSPGNPALEGLDFLKPLRWDGTQRSIGTKRSTQVPATEKITKDLATKTSFNINFSYKAAPEDAAGTSESVNNKNIILESEPKASQIGNQSAANKEQFHALIVAGNSPDSPTARIDINTDLSVFDGVASIRVNTRGAFYYIGSGTPISSNQVLTAAHVLDINGDGKSDDKDRVTGITINFNYGSSYSAQIKAVSWVTHPDFTGFNRPSINDDLAIITLSQPIPTGVPIYKLYSGSLSNKTLTMVGYGQSGSGSTGYTVDASLIVKRQGANVVDAFYGQDDSIRMAADEVWRYDFDSPTSGSVGPLGGGTLGNTIETTLGGGDSGGPSFVQVGGNYLLAGVNTFGQSTSTASSPYFGSMGGGISVPAYADWIKQQAPSAEFV